VPQGGAAPAVEAAKPPAVQAPGAPAPHVSGMPGPVPQEPGGGKPTRITLDQAEALAQANDIAGCRDAAQQMRRAGAAMPPALIALAGLRLDLLKAGQQP
jgi:hypothetical protein